MSDIRYMTRASRLAAACLATFLTLACPVLAEEVGFADPLRPDPLVTVSGVVAAAPETPRLSMIVRNTDLHYAIIDGQPRRVGDHWSGYKVLHIRSSSVILGREAGDDIELGLLSGAVIKKNPRS